MSQSTRLLNDNEFSDLQSNGLHRNQILNLIEQLRDQVKQKFSSMNMQLTICRHCMRLSCQHGAESLRNVSTTMLNPCHKECRKRGALSSIDNANYAIAIDWKFKHKWTGPNHYLNHSLWIFKTVLPFQNLNQWLDKDLPCVLRSEIKTVKHPLSI